MRMMKYALNLLGQGYVVASGPLYDSERPFGPKCLPIRFTVLRCSTKFRPVANIVELTCNENGWDWARPLYSSCKEVLQGIDHSWYLYSFAVTNHSLRLDFYNPDQRCSDYVLFDTAAGEAFTLEIQFEVPHSREEPQQYSQYSVLLISSPCSPGETQGVYAEALVTECHKDARREIEFTRDGGKFEKGHVIVTEYVDL